MLQHKINKLVKFSLFLGGGALLVLLFSSPSYAARVDELRAQIDTKSTEISALEKEIAEFQSQISKTGKEINSLSSAVKNLELTQKKLAADTTLTQKKIDSTTLNIERLQLDIGNKEDSIDLGRSALRDSLNVIRKLDEVAPVQSILGSGQLSDYWKTVAVTTQFSTTVEENLHGLREEKQDLEGRRDEAAKEKKSLEALKTKLADQKAIAVAAEKEKQALLKATKNTDANYRKVLAERVARRNAFEKELFAIESQLRIEINQSLLPAPGSKVLIYPLDPPIRVTQYFGDTDFARANAQVYNGKGHNAIDIAASVGTSIKAAQFGRVLGTGDTDLTCQGASLGKWVVIQHENGLSTLYAHLSLIKVSEGQAVSAGEIIAYSGNTGYTTGPHLHFGVYATQGLKIGSLQSKVAGCGVYRVPLASLNAVLNPLTYLP